MLRFRVNATCLRLYELLPASIARRTGRFPA